MVALIFLIRGRSEVFTDRGCIRNSFRGVVIFVDSREVAGLDFSAGMGVEIDGFDVYMQVLVRSLNGVVG